jgi:hypothetical protein
MTAAALDASQIGKIGIGIIIGLVVLGILLSLVVTALVGRLIILVVVVLLGGAVWQQRSHIEDNINKHKCNLSASFFGFSVKAPPDVVKACQQHLK